MSWRKRVVDSLPFALSIVQTDFFPLTKRYHESSVMGENVAPHWGLRIRYSTCWEWTGRREPSLWASWMVDPPGCSRVVSPFPFVIKSQHISGEMFSTVSKKKPTGGSAKPPPRVGHNPVPTSIMAITLQQVRGMLPARTFLKVSLCRKPLLAHSCGVGENPWKHSAFNHGNHCLCNRASVLKRCLFHFYRRTLTQKDRSQERPLCCPLWLSCHCTEEEPLWTRCQTVRLLCRYSVSAVTTGLLVVGHLGPKWMKSELSFCEWLLCQNMTLKNILAAESGPYEIGVVFPFFFPGATILAVSASHRGLWSTLQKWHIEHNIDYPTVRTSRCGNIN